MTSDLDAEYRQPYLHLWGRITDVSENLKTALECADAHARDRAMLRAVAELTKAQSDAEEIYLSRCL